MLSARNLLTAFCALVPTANKIHTIPIKVLTLTFLKILYSLIYAYNSQTYKININKNQQFSVITANTTQMNVFTPQNSCQSEKKHYLCPDF